MSANLQTLKGLYESFAKGDVPAVVALLHERIEWHEPESLPYKHQVGPQAVLENIFAKVVQDVTGFTVAPEEFVDGGHTIVSLGRYRGQGSRTGVSFDTPFAHVWKFTDGKISYFRTFTDTKVWVDALGA